MTTRVHEMTQVQINRLVEQVETVSSSHIDRLMVGTNALDNEMNGSNVQTGAIRKAAAAIPGPITSADELLDRMQKELALYQMIIDDLDTNTAKLTFDTFILQKLDAYRDALCKVRNACFEVLFCIDISK